MTESSGPGSWDSDQLKRQLQAMDDFDFEHLVADVWGRQGWETEVEQQSGDAGVDVRATKETPYPQKELIQAKRYSSDNPLGGPDIQQYAALKHQEPNVDKAIVVTTGRFTGSAEDRANDLNVKLIDGDDLVEMIDQSDAYDIIENYLGQTVSKASGDTRTSDATVGEESELYIPPKDREKLGEFIDGSIEEHLKEQRYRATRALEQAQAKIKINPHDAAKIGVFADLNDIDEIDPKREFEKHKTEMALLSDHIHVGSDGSVFVGDITDFIHGAVVDVGASENIVAIIERGVLDESWAGDGTLAKSRLKQAKQNTKNSTTEESSIQSSSLPPQGSSSRIENIAAGYGNYHYVAIGGFIAPVVGFLLVGTMPESVLGGIGALMFITPFAGIAGLVLDLGYIRQRDVEWSPSIVLGVIGALSLYVFYFAYYVYKRRKYIGL